MEENVTWFGPGRIVPNSPDKITNVLDKEQ